MVDTRLLSSNIFRHFSDVCQKFFRNLSNILQTFFRHLSDRSSDVRQMFIRHLSDVCKMFFRRSSHVCQMFVRRSSDIRQRFGRLASNIRNLFIRSLSHGLLIPVNTRVISISLYFFLFSEEFLYSYFLELLVLYSVLMLQKNLTLAWSVELSQLQH